MNQPRGTQAWKDLKWEVMLAREAKDKAQKDRVLALYREACERRRRRRERLEQARAWALVAMAGACFVLGGLAIYWAVRQAVGG